MAGNRSAEIVLQDDIVVLRVWRVDDAGWYVESRDEEVFRWTTEERTVTVADVEKAIAQVNAHEDTFGFAIVDANNCELLGNLALVLDETDKRRGEVMYWLSAKARGRGVATHAVRLICQWAFETVGLAEVTLQTHRDNLPSQRVAECVGFKRMEALEEESVHSEHLWFVLRRPWIA